MRENGPLHDVLIAVELSLRPDIPTWLVLEEGPLVLRFTSGDIVLSKPEGLDTIKCQQVQLNEWFASLKTRYEDIPLALVEVFESACYRHDREEWATVQSITTFSVPGESESIVLILELSNRASIGVDASGFHKLIHFFDGGVQTFMREFAEPVQLVKRSLWSKNETVD